MSLMSKYDLSLRIPYMNAAGSLGFAPDPHGRVDLNGLGAFVTAPVSRSPRAPSQERRCLAFPGGFLLHTGYPNPGLRAVLGRQAARWRRSPVPVWVHLIAGHPEEVNALVRQLERVDGVMGVEIGPPPDVEVGVVVDFARAAAGELPVVVRLPFERALELAGPLARLSGEGGLAAVSLAPPRGALVGPDGSLVHGRLYGPAVFPSALAAVQNLVKTGLPVIGAGGVYRRADADTMLSAGAFAVQFDAILWRGGIPG